MAVDVRRWVEQLAEMRLALEAAERGCLLIVAATDGSLEEKLAGVLAEALDDRPGAYAFDPAYPSLAAYLDTLSAGQPRIVLARGLDDLRAEPRRRALEYLNREREALRRVGRSVVLFIRPETVRDLTFQAGDFWAWRSGLFEFEAPHDEPDREEALAALRLSLPAPLEPLRRRYLEYIIATCRWLDFRGLMQVRNLVRLPLADVYIPLSATVEERRREAPEDVIEWREETGKPGKRREPERSRAMRVEAVTRRVELAQAWQENRRLVVLGDPGSGKSTFLKHLALTFAQGDRGGEPSLPVLVPIAAYALALRGDPDMRLADFLPSHFGRLGLPDLGPLFIHTMERGQAALLLDGLDEVVSAEERRAIVQAVKRLVAAYPQNRFVVTSRIAGYAAAPLGGDFASLTVAPFDSEDVARFARQWSRAYEGVGRERSGTLPPEIARRAEERADHLVTAVTSHPAIERLAVNPLLLTILALIHYQGARLPNQRVELYRLCVEALAESWNLARSLADRPVELWLGERRLDEREVVKVLGPVAYWMQGEKPGGLVEREELERRIASELEKEGRRGGEPQELAHAFVGLVREQVGLLVERGLGQFGFMHLTFQEYLAARHVAARRDPFTLLKPHLHDTRWREVVLLTAGVLGRHSEEWATDFVRAIRQARSPYESLLHRDLLLALGPLADDVPVDPGLRRRLIAEAADVGRRTRYDRLRREVFGQLAAMGGSRGEGEAATALLAALGDEDAEVRGEAARALGALGRASDEVICALVTALGDERVAVRQVAALALGWLGRASDEVIRALLTALGDEEAGARLGAAGALGLLSQASDEAFRALLTALRDKNADVRTEAAAALGVLGQASDEVIRALLAALRDEHWVVRWATAGTLGALGQASDEVIRALLDALGDEDELLRRSAAMALGALGQASDEAIRTLLAALGDEDGLVRWRAAGALGALGQTPDEVIRALLAPLRDENWMVRWEAAKTLGALGQASDEVIRALLAALADEDARVRQTVAGALGALGQASDEVIRALLAALDSENAAVRQAAAEALGKTGQASKVVMGALLTALRDEDKAVRQRAAEALVELDQVSQEVVGVFLAALQDRNKWMRRRAAKALGKLGSASDEAVVGLSRMLRSWHSRDVATAAVALAELGQPTAPLARRLALLLGYRWWLPWHLPWLPRCLRARATADTSALFEALWTVVERGPGGIT